MKVNEITHFVRNDIAPRAMILFAIAHNDMIFA